MSLSEILPVNLVDKLYLSVAVTGDKYCLFGRVQRPQKINYYTVGHKKRATFIFTITSANVDRFQ